MRALKLVLPAAFLMTGFLICTTASYGTAAYGTKEKQKCTYCHTKLVADKAEMAKNLNEAGKEYQKTLPPKK